jgi:plastocyanin
MQIAIVLAAVITLATTLVIATGFEPAYAEEISADVVSSTGVFYDPDPINAKVGDTVTWTNVDSQPHTVTSGSNGTPDGKFDSSPNFKPLMVSQGVFSHTFTEAGNYPYYCALHPNMVGTVVVTGDQPTSTESSVLITVNGTNYEIIAESDTTKITEASVEPGQDYTASFDKAGNVILKLPKAVFTEVTR